MTGRTDRIGHSPIRMRLVQALAQPGDFRWQEGKDGSRALEVVLPSSAGGSVRSSWPIGAPNGVDKRWQWDGNRERPTIRPALFAVGNWHGYVRRGFLVEA